MLPSISSDVTTIPLTINSLELALYFSYTVGIDQQITLIKII